MIWWVFAYFRTLASLALCAYSGLSEHWRSTAIRMRCRRFSIPKRFLITSVVKIVWRMWQVSKIWILHWWVDNFSWDFLLHWDLFYSSYWEFLTHFSGSPISGLYTKKPGGSKIVEKLSSNRLVWSSKMHKEEIIIIKFWHEKLECIFIFNSKSTLSVVEREHLIQTNYHTSHTRSPDK